MLDTKLRFDKHVNYFYGKVYPKLNMLSRIRYNIGQGTAIYLYNCLLNPLFAFSDVVYECLAVADAQKLQVLQNNCMRVCLRCDKSTSRRSLRNKTGIKALSTQRMEHTCSVVYQGLNQLSTPYITNLFSCSSSNSERVMRSTIKGTATIPGARLKVTSGNILVHGPKYYNNMPIDTREAKTLNAFKNRRSKLHI